MKQDFLYVWEYGAGIGHLMAALPLLDALVEDGWCGHAYIPRKAANIEACKEILQQRGLKFSFVAGSHLRVGKKMPVTDPVDVLLNLECFQTCLNVEFFARTWLQLFLQIKPDLVIGDYAPLPLSIAHGLGIPTVAMDAGYLYSKHARECTVSLEQLQDGEPHQFTKTREKSLGGLSALAAFFPGKKDFCVPDLLACAQLLYANYEALVPFAADEAATFINVPNPEYCSSGFPEVKWRQEHIPRVFAYLYLDTEHGRRLLAALAKKTEIEVIVYAAEAGKEMLGTRIPEHIQLKTEPIKLDGILSDSNLVICHGGAGMIAQALTAGKPLLLAPFHHEQKLNSERVSSMQAGLSMNDYGYDLAMISQLVDRLLFDASYTAHARAFKYRNPPFSGAEIKARLAKVGETAAVVKPGGWGAVKAPNWGAEVLDFNKMDIIFLSYDEPNADENWARLKSLCPHAKRVHGVKGIDRAHKAAAELAEGERFAIVDGDNWVDERLFSFRQVVPPEFRQGVWQWCSLNSVNGLAYAAGGIKVWPRFIIEGMRTHEANGDAYDSTGLDFWAAPYYFVFRPVLSTTGINGSAEQAFRTGFREGVKYALGYRDAREDSKAKHSILRRILIWMSVGSDVAFGRWSMIGSRAGFLYAHEREFKSEALTNINDYGWLKEKFLEAKKRGRAALAEGCSAFGGTAMSTTSEEVACLKETRLAVNSLLGRDWVMDMAPEESKDFKVELQRVELPDDNLFDLLVDGG